MHKYGRRDSNHAEIVKRLRLYPRLSVVDLADIGGGMGDILVGYRKQNFLFEIKDPAKCRSARKLTKDEAEFHRGFYGFILVVMTAEEVLKAINYNEFA